MRIYRAYGYRTYKQNGSWIIEDGRSFKEMASAKTLKDARWIIGKLLSTALALILAERKAGTK